ncbi:MAG: LytR C-terminal domain-containing protein [Ignavibacteriae bacterium]|nr:LytR family transcriptional regulator [Ignavibacteriota bacterium]NOG96716.1 LytR C-terminal domain-containing protein [Ignavibacteriota bacterium]
MSKKKKPAPKKSDTPNLKSSTLNLSLNVIIFLLGAFIIYLAYSLFLVINSDNNPQPKANNENIPAEIIQVEVLNGCGVNALADRFTDYLRLRNIDVVKTGNYQNFDIYESLVIDRSGNIANAYKVAQTLGIDKSKVIQQLNDDYFLDVSIVVGKDYHKLLPIKTGN